MANSKRTLFLKRRLRVRNKLRKVNAGRRAPQRSPLVEEYQRAADR